MCLCQHQCHCCPIPMYHIHCSLCHAIVWCWPVQWEWRLFDWLFASDYSRCSLSHIRLATLHSMHSLCHMCWSNWHLQHSLCRKLIANWYSRCSQSHMCWSNWHSMHSQRHWCSWTGHKWLWQQCFAAHKWHFWLLWWCMYYCKWMVMLCQKKQKQHPIWNCCCINWCIWHPLGPRKSIWHWVRSLCHKCCHTLNSNILHCPSTHWAVAPCCMWISMLHSVAARFDRWIHILQNFVETVLKRSPIWWGYFWTDWMCLSWNSSLQCCWQSKTMHQCWCWIWTVCCSGLIHLRI